MLNRFNFFFRIKKSLNFGARLSHWSSIKHEFHTSRLAHFYAMVLVSLLAQNGFWSSWSVRSLLGLRGQSYFWSKVPFVLAFCINLMSKALEGMIAWHQILKVKVKWNIWTKILRYSSKVLDTEESTVIKKQKE